MPFMPNEVAVRDPIDKAKRLRRCVDAGGKRFNRRLNNNDDGTGQKNNHDEALVILCWPATAVDAEKKWVKMRLSPAVARRWRYRCSKHVRDASKNFAAEISIESIWRNGNGKHANGNVVLIYLLSNGVSRARLISAESIFSCGFLNSVLSQSARARVCAKYDRDK